MRSSFCTVLFVVALFFSGTHCQAQMVIIANANFGIGRISKDDVRSIFTGATTTSSSGLHATPVLLKRGPIHDEFLATFIGEKEMQFRSDWMSQLFAGRLLLPPHLASEEEMVDYVANHSSSIGYIHMSTPHKRILVLTIY